MTIGLIRHGTPRAGFKGWPSEELVPGKEEAHIAAMAYPDPDWEKTPSLRKYENIAKHPRAKQ